MPAAINGRFALNHMVAPTLDVAAFFDLAVGLGTRSVEIRNDIKGVEILTGRSAADIAALAAAKKITILSINALQRFNDWSSARAKEAEQLAAFATACGAKALVLCPVNDTAYTPSDADKAQNLRTALKELQPILAARHLTGLVEPLGFVECSLRRKADAIAAIDDTGTGATFKVLHDTFHHHVAGETELFPAAHRPRPYLRRQRRRHFRRRHARSSPGADRQVRPHRQCRADRPPDRRVAMPGPCLSSPLRRSVRARPRSPPRCNRRWNFWPPP